MFEKKAPDIWRGIIIDDTTNVSDGIIMKDVFIPVSEGSAISIMESADVCVRNYIYYISCGWFV